MITNRLMKRTELDVVLDWAAAEGWNPGLDDAEAFWATDPEGFFVAEQQGELLAAISVVRHSKSFAFLGLYICQAEHRGRGIGLSLWNDAIAHAGNRTVGLDGVAEQQANYERSGFKRVGATTRYSGRPSALSHNRVVDATDADISELIALEATASGWKKQTYLYHWFAPTANRQTVVIREDENIVAAATFRRCREGVKIGPFLAKHAQLAAPLLQHISACVDAEIIIDVPAEASDVALICQKQNMLPIFGTARMFRGTIAEPAAEASFQYCPSTLELG